MTTPDAGAILTADKYGPYGVRNCRGHFHITCGDEDIINKYGDALDEVTARRGAAEMNAEYLASVEALKAENARLQAALEVAEAERDELNLAVDRLVVDLAEAEDRAASERLERER